MKNNKMKICNIIPFVIIMMNIFVHYNISIYEQYSSYVIYLSLALYIGAMFLYKNTRCCNRELLIVIAAVTYSFFTSVFNGNSLGAIVAYLELFIVSFALSKLEFSRNEKIILVLVVAFMSAKYIMLSKNYYLLWFHFPQEYLNPNIVGMFLYYSFAIICAFGNVTIKKRKVVFGIMWVFFLYAEYCLRCRTYMIVSFIMGCSVLLVPIKMWKNEHLIKKIIIGVVMAGCIFPCIYVAISMNIQLSIFVHDITGKYLFTGREYTWINFIDYERNHIEALLFGAGSWSESLFSEKFSLHNSYLGIVMNFGVVGLLLYVLYLMILVDLIYRINITSKQIVMLLAFIGGLVASCSEIVLQAPMSSLLIGLLLGQARLNNDCLLME